MVFTSLPLYLDPPNWNQHQQQLSEMQPTAAIQSAPASTNNTSGPAGSTGGGTRPTSMADRARMAKIPQPEMALKCPRCESTNTKFCYFNNYSLSQPRHFCKTCRRYWTRGGALRSVPVGGGCRRNKRSSSKSSKSTSNAADRNASSSTSSTATSGSSSVMPSSFHAQLPFLTPLHTLSEYGMPNLGLNFARMQPMDNNYHSGGGASIGLDQWRIQQLQQFPFLGELDNSSAAAVMTMAPSAGIYSNPFDGGESGEGFHGEVVLPKATSSSLISQLASVKMEDSNSGLNLARQYLGLSGGGSTTGDHHHHQFWGGAGTGGNWDITGFNSTNSSGNLL